LLAVGVRRARPLDGGKSAAVFESITLQHEGWQRDPDVAEPTEPSFSD
jgi:hypothetical protein